MRFSTIFTVLGVCCALGGTGCASVQKMEKQVQDEVKKNPAVADEALTVAAKAELAKNAKTKGAGFDVSVKGGVATLTGSGPADAKAEAEKAIKVPGVTKVTNNIVVK
jgi:osmotically-inducible protein OsmY